MPLGEVEVWTVGAVPMAAVVGPANPRDITAELGRRMDVVWDFIRRGSSLVHGHNVFVYHGPPPASGGWEIEVGVQVDRTFPDADPVVCRMTPAGRVATTTWTGPHEGIAAAQQALAQWCADQGLERTGLTWEVYGDWVEPPGQPDTDLFHLLADATAVPVPARADVEVIAGALSDDEWAACQATVEREGAVGVEVTAAYLAFAVEQGRTEG